MTDYREMASSPTLWGVENENTFYLAGRTEDTARLAAEYAERYCLDHHGLDDELWGRMKAAYSDREIVELSMCLGSWIAFGRLNHVLGLDSACVLPDH